MNLVLRGLSLNDNPISQAIVGRFDERGGSIGRSDNATLTLPDPERMISRVQANVTFSDGGYWLVDVGSANPVVHNGQALGSGVTVRLKAHDDLRIGGYRLAVEYEDDTSGATILRGRTTSQPRPLGDANSESGAARASNAGADNPFADLMAPQVARPGGANATDPFADLLAPGRADPPLAAPSAARAATPASAADPFADLMGTPAQTPVRLPDDFDPFADPAPQPAPANPGDPFALVGTTGPSIDDAFGLNQAGGHDPLAGFLGQAAGAHAALSPEVSLDPLVALGGATPSASAQAALPDHVPELAGAYRPPQVRAAAAALRSPAPAPAEREPVVQNDTPANRALNRRVEITLLVGR